MKKLLLAILPLLAVSYSYAQNTFPDPGYVGIGTKSPSTLLDIYNSANSSTTILRISGSSETPTSYSGLLLGSGGLQGRGKGAVLYQPYGTSYGLGKLHFAVNGSPGEGEATLADIRMTITSGGRVGINTTVPNGLLSLGAGISNNRFLIYDDGNDASGFGQGVGEFRLYSPSSSINHMSFGLYTLSTDSFVEQMRLDHNGNLGIGTTQPDQKLTVNGTVHATEVLVDQTVKTPDYVFDKDYDLTSLKDVKSYIDKNHHLPEIPSAAQVAKEGINLGEMNAKLLKKIEELTLYLIQQKVATDQQIRKLKARINKLSLQQKAKSN